MNAFIKPKMNSFHLVVTRHDTDGAHAHKNPKCDKKVRYTFFIRRNGDERCPTKAHFAPIHDVLFTRPIKSEKIYSQFPQSLQSKHNIAISVTFVFHIIGDLAVIRNGAVCDNPESHAVVNLAERMTLHDLSHMGIKKVQFADGRTVSICDILNKENTDIPRPMFEGPI